MRRRLQYPSRKRFVADRAGEDQRSPASLKTERSLDRDGGGSHKDSPPVIGCLLFRDAHEEISFEPALPLTHLIAIVTIGIAYVEIVIKS
jgi:hypothetical protein